MTDRMLATAWILLCLLAPATAHAQGFYYKEVVKDGRIYVFNDAANADRFARTGEMPGTAITRAGVGPAGETVVADSARALELYFFKHGIAEVVSEPAPSPPPAPPAAATPSFRISGLMFGDYYGFADHHLPAWEGQHGLWFRRIYFTYDQTFTPKLSARLRLEANGNGKLQGGLLEPYVKDASLRWNFAGRQAVVLGIQPSLTFEYTEMVWGLRHIEKTPLDLYRIDASRDTGVTLSGPINTTQTLKYALQYGNDSGNSGETDRFKAVRATVRYETNPGFTVEGMFGQFQRDRDADRTTAQVFAAYRAKKGRAGAQYSYQKRRAAQAATDDIDLDILSVFGVYDIRPQRLSTFLRVDRFADACAECAAIDYLPIDTRAPFTTTIAGVEFFVVPSVRFSPNVEWVAYDTPSTGAKTKDAIVGRLTFYWTW